MAVDLNSLLTTEEQTSMIVTVQEAQSLLNRLEGEGWTIVQPNKQVVLARKGSDAIRFYPRPSAGNFRVSGPRAVLSEHGLKA